MTSSDNPRFAGNVAFITGAGSGIGRACAIAFAREGARVVAVDRTEAHSTGTIEAIEATGGRALAVGCDVTSNADVGPRSGRPSTRSAVKGFPGGAAYGASKYGVIGLTKCAALDDASSKPSSTATSRI